MVSAELENNVRNHTSHLGRDSQRHGNYDIENFENSSAHQQMINSERFQGEKFKRESQTVQSEHRTTETNRDSRLRQEQDPNASFDKAASQREYHYDATSIASEGARGREGRRRYSTYDTVTAQRDDHRRMSYDGGMPTDEQFDRGNRESAMEQSHRTDRTQEERMDKDDEGEYGYVNNIFKLIL